MTSDSDRQAIDDYLARLRRGLRRLPASEKDEIVAEIRGHVLERVEARGDEGERFVDEVLRAIGDPAQLAAQYETQALLRQAASTRSPWRLLRTTLRWARQGVAGASVFVLTLLGYGAALVCYACAIAKPVFPSHIGMWLTPEQTVTIGYWSGRLPSELMGLTVGPRGLAVFGTLGPTQGPVRELLGPWLIPAGIVAGFLCAAATTWCVRWLAALAARRPVRARATVPA